MRRGATAEEKEQNRKEERMRAKGGRAARRGGRPAKREGKVSKSPARTRTPRSQKKIATVNKRRQ